MASPYPYPDPKYWFTQGEMRRILDLKAARIILTKPHPTKWKVGSIITAYEHQMSKEKARGDSASFAAIRLPCTQVGKGVSGTQAMMRIYLQIPFTDMGFLNDKDRGRQARKFTPRELEAYQKLSANEESKVHPTPPRIPGSNAGS